MMKNPPHPGEVFRRNYLEPLGLSITHTAKALHVSRQHLSELAHGHRPVSVSLAMKLGALTRTTPRFWVNMQVSYDLWEHRNDKVDVAPIPELAYA